MHKVQSKKPKIYLYQNDKKTYYKDLNALVAKVHRYTFERHGGRVFTMKGMEYLPDFVLSFYPKERYSYGRYWCTGGKRNRSRWLRQPRTTQERRWRNAWDEDGFDIKYRKRMDLIDSWDDIRCSDYGIKSWKQSRRHQWKVVDTDKVKSTKPAWRKPIELKLRHPSLYCKIYRNSS